MQPVAKKKHRPPAPGRKRLLLLLLAGLLAVGGGIYFLTRPEELPVVQAERTYGEMFAHATQDLATLTLTLRDGERYTLEQGMDGTFALQDTPAFLLAQSEAEELFSSFSIIAYERVLAENKGEYAEHFADFGLTSPRVTAEITYRDGTQLCVRIGDKSAAEDDNWYYMEIEGDDRLFALSKGTAENVNVHLATLHEVTQPTIHQARLDAITFAGAEGDILAQWQLQGAITDSDAAGNWRMTVPYAYPADKTAMTNLRKNLGNLRLGAFVEVAKEDNLATYGLDAPRFTLTLHMAAGTMAITSEEGVYTPVDWPESTFTLAVGAAKSDTVEYVLVEGNIYLCSSFSLAVFTQMDALDTLSRYPLMVSLEELASLEVFAQGETTEYILTRQERVAANNALETDAQGNVLWEVLCTRNGEAISYDVFAAAWQSLYTVRVTGRLPQGYQPQGEIHTSLTFTTTTGRVHTLALTPYDALHDAVLVDGTALFYLISGGIQFETAGTPT